MRDLFATQLAGSLCSTRALCQADEHSGHGNGFAAAEL